MSAYNLYQQAMRLHDDIVKFRAQVLRTGYHAHLHDVELMLDLLKRLSSTYKEDHDKRTKAY